MLKFAAAPVVARPSLPTVVAANSALLTSLAGRYIWWKSPAEAMEFPKLVIAQVMNSGTFADLTRLASALGDDVLREVIRDAEAGQFDDRGWHYWHYRLGLAEADRVPPLPVKRIPA